MRSYDVLVHTKAIDFVVTSRHRRKLLHAIEALGSNPFADPDFTEATEDGEICGRLVGEYVVLFRIDHASRQIRVADVTYADAI